MYLALWVIIENLHRTLQNLLFLLVDFLANLTTKRFSICNKLFGNRLCRVTCTVHCQMLQILRVAFKIVELNKVLSYGNYDTNFPFPHLIF